MFSMELADYFYFVCIFRKNKEIKGFLKEILIFNLKRVGGK